ncbi:uncharacterized protein LOC119066303 [Bradysia coprophila]|uniref:uncharacterized protein LOC119066303 n=1 Tax=Bradysia coprophila TaxID=38358 RepID=UPI00187DC6FD|nr:uncharacterized protein LOC119066303 [Bradysia coprophila]XP_037024579.1 uncharacterized protein LOC119066303 [Bradysia coprophila]XP_037024580.1 uncharacterized protein LOC119066303 [Bradysia coprophila]XP_037024581.1 uncharacterized protein LOC119066303 [Bradysia coprophila]
MLLKHQTMDIRLLIPWLFFLVTVNGLRDVRVTVPAAVKRGDNAELICLYDMEGDSLYSVKWYKGRREFYRYTPKENPAMKTFSVNGIIVERSLSDESRLTLSSVQPSVTGKYSCEVSADAPSFHTLIESGDLEVVEVPEHRPFIVGIRPRYRVGDSLRANCTSKHSKPAANLTWIVNDLPPNPLYVRTYRTSKDHRNDFETSLSGIQFVITDQHFIKGKLKIRCVSQIHDIYFQKTEKTIEHDRPKPSASASNSVNNINTNPYDYQPHDSDVVDKQDTYMTQIQGDMSSLSGYKTYAASTTTLMYSLLFSIFLSKFYSFGS